LKYACRRLLTGALLLHVAITVNAQALSTHKGHAATPLLTAEPVITAPQVTAPRATATFANEISRLTVLERPSYGGPVTRPVIAVNTDLDQTFQISQLNQDFIQREVKRAQRERAASQTPRFTLAGDPPLAMILLALGIASAQKRVDPDTAGSASALRDLLNERFGDRSRDRKGDRIGGRFGVSTGS
jgi:hypothetical protein